MQLPELKSVRSGPVKVTTGLGLPLCRGFAHASGGWLALDESLNDGMTHFWCVLESTSPANHRLDVKSRWLESGDPNPGQGQSKVHPEMSPSRTVQSHTSSSSRWGYRLCRVEFVCFAALGEIHHDFLTVLIFRDTIGEDVCEGSAVDSVDNRRSSVNAFDASMRCGVVKLKSTCAVLPEPTSGDHSMTCDDLVDDAMAPAESLTETPVVLLASAASCFEATSTAALQSTPSLTTRPVPRPPVLDVAVAVGGRKPLSLLRVAIVDDEPANQRIASRFLKGLGVSPSNIITLSDGEGSCSFLLSSVPALVIIC
jgi:CheY-like chemotaxis protein